jgi:hypothetical protein
MKLKKSRIQATHKLEGHSQTQKKQVNPIVLLIMKKYLKETQVDDH